VNLLDKVGNSGVEIKKLREIDERVRVGFRLTVTPFSDEVSLYFGEATMRRVSEFNGDFDIEFFEV
jgi:hypothetical protein